jgi:hypothetical protein
MFSRGLTLVAAIVLAVLPTVRAICDVNCVSLVSAAVKVVSVPAPAGHCAHTEEGTPATPTSSEDGCGHQHQTPQTTFTAAPGTTAPLDLAAVTSTLRYIPSGTRRISLAPVVNLTAPSPPLSHSHPLRI